MSQWHKGCSFIVWRAVSGTEGGQAMKPLVTDALWQRLEPWLPPPPPRRFRFPGRERAPAREPILMRNGQGSQPAHPEARAVTRSAISFDIAYLSRSEGLGAGSLRIHSSGSTFFLAKPLIVPPRT